MKTVIRLIALCSLSMTLVSCMGIPKEGTLREVASQRGRYAVTEIHYNRARKEARVGLQKKDPKGGVAKSIRWYAYDRETRAWRLLPMVAIRRPDTKE